MTHESTNIKIAFGGGCHWCTEAVFGSLRGVVEVNQGWIASEGEDQALSEGVIVHYDPTQIRLIDLIEVHLHTHSSQSNHRMRGKYRSAIYHFEGLQAGGIQSAIALLQSSFANPIITQVLPFRAFKPSREEIAGYYFKNPGKPFCETYIEPKLRLLQEKFPSLMANRSGA